MKGVSEVLEESFAALEQLNQEHVKDIESIEKRFTLKDLERAVWLAFDFRISRVKEMRDDAISASNKEAAKGVPFKVRPTAIKSKLDWCDSELKRIADMRKNFVVKPFRYWLKKGDYKYMQTIGLRRFAELHLEEMIHMNT